MKKNVLGVFLLTLTLALAGCNDQSGQGQANQEQTAQSGETQTGENEEAKIYISELEVKDLVELGEYKGIKAAKQSTEVSEEMLESYLSYMMSFQSQLAAVTDRDVVKMGDTVTIDYEGKKDGVAFEGGTASDYNLGIGSGSFIEGFEEGLVGVKKGETVDLNLTFPSNYAQKDLAGAEVVFTVTVKEILTLVTPELNDKYVQELGMEGIKTVEDYRNSARDMLKQQMEEEANYQLQASLIETLMADSTIQEPSEELKQKYQKTAMAQAQAAADYYGLSMEDYVMSAYEVSLEEYEAKIQSGASEAAKQAMLCKKIADEEGIHVSDEELEETIKENCSVLGYASAEEFKEANDIEEYRDSLLLDKVLNFLVENASITEEDHTGHDHE